VDLSSLRIPRRRDHSIALGALTVAVRLAPPVDPEAVAEAFWQRIIAPFSGWAPLSSPLPSAAQAVQRIGLPAPGGEAEFQQWFRAMPAFDPLAMPLRVTLVELQGGFVALVVQVAQGLFTPEALGRWVRSWADGADEAPVGPPSGWRKLFLAGRRAAGAPPSLGTVAWTEPFPLAPLRGAAAQQQTSLNALLRQVVDEAARRMEGTAEATFWHRQGHPPRWIGGLAERAFVALDLAREGATLAGAEAVQWIAFGAPRRPGLTVWASVSGDELALCCASSGDDDVVRWASALASGVIRALMEAR